MTNYDIVKEKTGGSPEGAAAFMIEVFILGFNLAVECMETGEMAPDAEVLARYFLWFLAKDPEETGEPQKDPEALKEAARAQMANVREAIYSGENTAGGTEKKD